MFVAGLICRVSPERRVEVASWGVIVALVAWPITSLTVFSGEPQGILGLSWTALILTCLNIVMTTDVRREQEEG